MWSELSYPWEAVIAVREEHALPESSIDCRDWCSHIIVDRNSVITNSTTGSKFPSTRLNEEYNIIELPRPSLKGDSSREIILDIDNKQKITYSFYANGSISVTKEMISQFELLFDRTMDAILFFIRECLKVERIRTGTIYWDNILKEIHKNKVDDPAKYSLVVDLARVTELVEPMDRITSRPKRVLKRVHDLERIQKVQEIDTKCLIDLARRPGTVLAEKAGSRQRILAIKRTESIDVMENRVTKHCCSLAVTATKRYLRDHESIDVQNSPRKESVEKLQRASLKLPTKSTFDNVTSLVEPCRQPNYTLMQNPDYNKVWRAYTQLVRNEDLRLELWKWNRRMWVDFTGLFLANLILSYQRKSLAKIQRIGDKIVFGKRKQDSGKWFEHDTLPGPFIINGQSDLPSTLYCIEGNESALSSLFDEHCELTTLNADYLLILLTKTSKAVFPIYSILPPQHLNKIDCKQYVNNILPSLIKNVRCFDGENEWICKQGWVLLGNWPEVKYVDKVSNLGKGITCWTSSIEADYHSWEDSFNDYTSKLKAFIGV